MSADRTRPERRFDPLALVAGLATLAIAGYVLSDGPQWMGVPDMRWVLAGTAVMIGLGMFASSFRKR
ncbi:hypothetical protein [Saccharomonospora sp. CUA-673]|uniref:hypothetical protein n=1 Tax=Saccharomonospora sp. CUA-673 TaxID=1904969 RepID=UPI0009FA01F8|nr:hypothetical protein [Saccharomonospora sp. CUA-673]